MNLRKFSLASVLVFAILCAFLPGCSGGGNAGGGGFQGALPAPKGGQSAAGFVLKRGWNLVKYPLAAARKFTCVTMTWQEQTRLLKDAVSPGWTQAQIRYLRGRAIGLLSTASLTAAFQPGGSYYVYSSQNGIVLSFEKPYIGGIDPSSCPPGTAVTVSGVNFGAIQGTSVVSLNGVPLAVTPPWSDTSLTFTAPMDEGSGKVKVTVGTLESNGVDFSVVIPPPGSLKWSYSFSTSYSDVKSSPAIGGDGTVYVGANDRKLYALNPDGTLKWSFTVAGQIGYSSPCIGPDGIIYMPDSMIGKSLYAIRDDGTQGTSVWTYTASSGNMNGTPAIASDGTVYVANSGLQSLMAIRNDGNLKWSLSIGDARTAPAIGTDGTIYIGSKNFSLYAIRDEGTQGTVKWSLDTGAAIYSSPAIGSDGTVFFASNSGYLYAVRDNGDTSTILWQYPLGSSNHYCSPSLGADGTVYLESAVDGYLYAVKSDGTLKWSLSIGSAGSYSSPVVGSGGRIYIGSNDGYVYAVDDKAEYGEVAWSYNLEKRTDSSPALGPDGTIYIGRDRIADNTGALYAINTRDTLASSAWPMFHHDIRHTGVK